MIFRNYSHIMGAISWFDRVRGILIDESLRSFFFYGCGYHRDLHSFPTRRSSDLMPITAAGDFGATIATLPPPPVSARSEEHTSELQSQSNLVCRLLLEKKKVKDR